MSQGELEAADSYRAKYLERELELERRCRKCRKEPPSKERIEEVSTAVLSRRAQAIQEELRRRSRGG